MWPVKKDVVSVGNMWSVKKYVASWKHVVS